MNRFHRWYCRSAHWKGKIQKEILPWVLRSLDLGDAVLELGPGPGVTTDGLRGLAKSIECLEINAGLARSLRNRLIDTNVHVRQGDASAMPYDDCSFSAVVSFTMLHHLPSSTLQDQLFAEAHRVLRLGGVFAGMDSVPSFLLQVIHLGDTMVLVDPASLHDRLASVGFTSIEIEVGAGRFRFSARRSVGNLNQPGGLTADQPWR